MAPKMGPGNSIWGRPVKNRSPAWAARSSGSPDRAPIRGGSHLSASSSRVACARPRTCLSRRVHPRPHHLSVLRASCLVLRFDPSVRTSSCPESSHLAQRPCPGARRRRCLRPRPGARCPRPHGRSDEPSSPSRSCTCRDSFCQVMGCFVYLNLGYEVRTIKAVLVATIKGNPFSSFSPLKPSVNYQSTEFC
jgi:hypothetical protein